MRQKWSQRVTTKNTSVNSCFMQTRFSYSSWCYYLGQDGDSEGLVTVFTHQVKGDDWKDVPGCHAGLPTYQLLPEPEPRGKLLCLRKMDIYSIHSLVQMRVMIEGYPNMHLTRERETHWRSCFNSLDCSLEDFSRQSEVGGATVHDALVIVVL